MAVSKKASARMTSPRRTEAGKQAVSRKAQQANDASAAANDARSAREVVRNRTKNIQGHVRSQGQRQQTRRDSR